MTEQMHDIQIDFEQEFCEFKEFLYCKNAVEKVSLSSFVKMHGSYKTVNYTKNKLLLQIWRSETM